jgi:hypothetical protein
LDEEISSRLYREEDTEKIINILKRVFDYWRRYPSPLDYWNWRYLETPIKKNIISLGLVNNEIVGCSHNNSLGIKLNDKTGFCYLIGSSAVLPEYQGKGVYIKIRALHNEIKAKEGSILNFWITENPILIESDKKQGYYPFPFKIKQLVNIKNIDLYFKTRKIKHSFVKKMVYKSLTQFNKHKPGITWSGTPNFRIEKVSYFPQSIDNFWNKIKDNYSFILERNQEYLNWRYCDVRGGDYSKLVAFSGDEIIGFIVTSEKQVGNSREGFIVDYLVLPEELMALRALFERSCDYLFSKGINRISCWSIEGSNVDRVMPRMGFLYDFTDRYIGIEIDDKEYDLLSRASPKMIHLVNGDVETL